MGFQKLATIIYTVILCSVIVKGQSLESIPAGAYRVEDLGNGIKELYDYQNRYITTKYTGQVNIPLAKLSVSNIDTTVIKPYDMDTTGFPLKFNFKTRAEVTNFGYDEPVIFDTDRDGAPEFYGNYEKMGRVDTFGLVCHEYNPGKNSFEHRLSYSWPRTRARKIVDIEDDGKYEVIFSTYSIYQFFQYQLYTQPAEDELTKDSLFTYAPNEDGDDEMYEDLDGDGEKEFVFFNRQSYQIMICEYRPEINNFELVYHDTVVKYTSGGGTGIGDLDGDGYPEITVGTINGDVMFYEYSPEEGYRRVFQSEVATANVYMHIVTDDINKNGKKEAWIGGDGYHGNIPMTRFTLFEATGDNEYEPVHVVDIEGIFSWWSGNEVSYDIDGDGDNELMICIDQNILFLDFTGEPGENSYEVIYLYQNHGQFPYTIYKNAGITDIDNNGKPEFLVGLSYLEDGVRDDYSLFFERDKISDVNHNTPEKPEGYYISQNYPNPFNPSTMIKYQLPEAGNITVKIYDVLGNDVKTLVNEFKTEGKYEVEFNATGLASGVYLYHIQAGKYTATKKMMLLK